MGRQPSSRGLLKIYHQPHGAHSNSLLLSGRMRGVKPTTIRPSEKRAFVVAADGSILPASAYDPKKWHILVYGRKPGAA